MRFTVSEKQELIKMVVHSDLGVVFIRMLDGKLN